VNLDRLLALPLDLALEQVKQSGLRAGVVPYGPPRATDLTVEDPRDWRIAQVRESDATVTLVAVPAGQLGVNLTTMSRGDAKQERP
jgi:hypothetical protein